MLPGNKLLVTASPKKIAEVEKIVDEIDVPSIQIMLEARLIEVAINDQEELGLDWEKLASTTLIFADGFDVWNLTNNAATDVYPSWSPDGTKIAFGTNRDGNYEIYVMIVP